MLKTEPLVSIIIPTYNRPDFLKKAIESAKAQSYQQIEIIIVDDASDINVADQINESENITFLRNKENRGGGYSRNRGLKNARGQYINFLDDDDILYKDKITKQLKVFKNSSDPNLGMVTCHALDKRSGAELIKYNRVRGDVYRKVLSSYAVFGTETMLFKRSCLMEINGFDEALESSQEYDVMIRFAEKHTVDYVDEVLTEKYRSRDQISMDFNKKFNGARHLFVKHSYRFWDQGVVFWMVAMLKYLILYARFGIGKLFGEKIYRILMLEGVRSKKK